MSSVQNGQSVIIVETAVFLEHMEKLNARLDALSKGQQKDEPFADLPELLNRKQTADVLGLTLPTVDRWAREKRIKKISVHGSPRFRKSEILKFKIWQTK